MRFGNDYLERERTTVPWMIVDNSGKAIYVPAQNLHVLLHCQSISMFLSLNSSFVKSMIIPLTVYTCTRAA